MTSPPPPSTADLLVAAIVAYADICEAAAIQNANAREQALTLGARAIVQAAATWITDQYPQPTPPAGS